MSDDRPIPAPNSAGEFILYQTEDGRTRLEVRMAQETIWLSQKAMAELFQKDVRTINDHIRNIIEEGELREDLVIRKYRITAADGKTYDTLHYDLDVILAVGYRVKSLRGTQFRIWATERLREYLIKGFAMDDARLKRAGGGNYFEELLARIRDIRSSERVFWRKVLDIYATSIDYDPKSDSSLLFFKTVQNKMHWAAHGHTAAEVIHLRADASQPNMGLTTWDGDRPRKADVSIAKLGGFLKLSDREILTHAGKISHNAAKEKAEAQFLRFNEEQAKLPQPVDQHFAETLEELKKIESQAKATKKKAIGKDTPPKEAAKNTEGKKGKND